MTNAEMRPSDIAPEPEDGEWEPKNLITLIRSSHRVLKRFRATIILGFPNSMFFEGAGAGLSDEGASLIADLGRTRALLNPRECLVVSRSDQPGDLARGQALAVLLEEYGVAATAATVDQLQRANKPRVGMTGIHVAKGRPPGTLGPANG